MEPIKLLEILSTCIVVVGMIGIALVRVWGLYLLVLGAVTWALFGYLEEHYFFLGQNLFILIINTIGIINWHKKGTGN